MDKKQKALQVIAGILEMDVNLLNPDMKINDIEGWDSMAHLQIIGELEDLFHVSVPIEKFTDMKIISDILGYLD